jgi:hypothetical protein
MNGEGLIVLEWQIESCCFMYILFRDYIYVYNKSDLTYIWGINSVSKWGEFNGADFSS